jgi:hypothetical protein
MDAGAIAEVHHAARSGEARADPATILSLPWLFRKAAVHDQRIDSNPVVP